MYGPFY